MLKIGLTGGIGAGKSTVSAMLSDMGAVIVDADLIAREVVEPGQPLLDEIAAEFGAEVLTPQGSLDRARLAELAFIDEASTQRLNALIHPAIRERTQGHFDRHADAEIVVHDVPLLVENSMSANYHLCLLVDVPADVRLARLMASRGMERSDAEARIARQASDAQRRAACDIHIDNEGSPDETRATVETLVLDRLRPFAANLRAERWAPRTDVTVDPDPAAAARVSARIRRATSADYPLNLLPRSTDSAAAQVRTPGLIELELLVPDRGTADFVAPALARAGLPGEPRTYVDNSASNATVRFHANCDPGQAVNLFVRTLRN